MAAPISARAITEDCRSRGYLAKQLYVISTRPRKGMEPVMENLQSHLAYQEGLERDGVMFAAGPLWTNDEQHWEGDGMVVIRASSLAEARAIAESDPMHSSGARSMRPLVSS